MFIVDALEGLSAGVTGSTGQVGQAATAEEFVDDVEESGQATVHAMPDHHRKPGAERDLQLLAARSSVWQGWLTQYQRNPSHVIHELGL